MLPGSLANRMDRNAAAPIVPPMERKNVTEEVATPISRGDAAFWAAVTIGCIDQPRPRPIRVMQIMTSHSAVSAVTRDSNSSETSMTAPPAIGNALYRPDFKIGCTDTIEPVI